MGSRASELWPDTAVTAKRRKPRAALALGLLPLLVGLALSACADPRDASDTEAIAKKVSPDQYFEASCAFFDPGTAFDVFLNGMDEEQIAELTDALDYAWAAAEGDSAAYESYAASLQAFAEGMGQVVAMDNDPRVAPDEILSYMTDIPFPDTSPECPAMRPDTGGLPLPGEGPTAVVE